MFRASYLAAHLQPLVYQVESKRIPYCETGTDTQRPGCDRKNHVLYGESKRLSGNDRDQFVGTDAKLLTAWCTVSRYELQGHGMGPC